jgi:membrane associated rhomboid family serine protease
VLDRWAYRGRVNDLESRQRRLDRAHFLIRAELVIAFAAPVVVGLMWMAAPGTIGPMFDEPPPFTSLVPWAAVVGVIVGILWMLRLSRPDPEAGERTWRYRDF